MKPMPWLVLLSLLAVSCSGSKSAQKVESDTPQIELSDADEFIENPAEGSTETTAENTEAPLDVPETTDATPVAAEGDALAAADAGTTSTDTMPTSEPLVSESNLENSQPVVSTSTYASSSEAGAIKTYAVQKNETLMMIAFKLYGDYSKWKELSNHNGGISTVRAGMNLKYAAPAEEFIWNPQGNPYLIRTGDTLGGISKQVYADIKKWKLLWENNRPLIKNPNKIYAGFTIYYLENGREVANQQ